MSALKINSNSLMHVLKGLDNSKLSHKNTQNSESGSSFKDFLVDVNSQIKTADTKAMNLSVGNDENIHEVMLAATKAELSVNYLVALRNKGLEVYNDVMKMPV